MLKEDQVIITKYLASKGKAALADLTVYAKY
jgi:hypothetical protein